MTVLQNFYEETITASLSTGTVKMYVSGKPIADATSGWVVINPGNTSRREIVAFDAIGTDGSGDFIELSERGVGGTTEQTHEVGEPVRLNITAEHWAALEATVADSIPATYLDTDGTLAADSDTKIPSQKATKTYVDTQDALLVSKEGDQTINGEKTFSESPIVPEPTTDFQAATKKYADDIAVAGAPNAGETTKGLVQEATQAEIDAKTDVGGTGARLFIVPSKLPSGVVIETFNANGTWTKPSSGTFARIQIWGGGGSGMAVSTSSSASTSNISGGGGGAYYQMIIPLSKLGSTEQIIVGLGGASATKTGNSGYADGNDGNQSSFGGTKAIALGGSGGTSAGNANGGDSNYFDSDGGNGGSNSLLDGKTAIHGGGGGGNTSTSNSIAPGDGGISVAGGNGGGGTYSSQSASLSGEDGEVPAGGGGGIWVQTSNTSITATSGAGGNGRVIVTTF